ncbi:hypothetical protein LTR56_000944 [Elasticomyces elasticus]|nr:hypothetical protein LTR56_000944 [Elasticomyces elasticus]KAK3665518.1 hypothetical protein LTR22_003748 [Elasticomyces elasticus]KAK4929839.1 hypothetical protein LTR49_003466 [Elasticomyces elasticus]KAK5759460.1 hypothetical protein LTS12_010473 [Elasticomyces elasticus]
MTAQLAHVFLAALARRFERLPFYRQATPDLPFTITYIATKTIPSTSTVIADPVVTPLLDADSLHTTIGFWILIASLLLVTLSFGIVAHGQHLLAVKRDHVLQSLQAARDILTASERAMAADRLCRANFAEQKCALLYTAALRRISDLESEMSNLKCGRLATSDAANVTHDLGAITALSGDVTEALEAALKAQTDAAAEKLAKVRKAQTDVAAVALEQTYRDTAQALRARAGVKARSKVDNRVKAGLRAGLVAAGLPADGIAYRKAELGALAPKQNVSSASARSEQDEMSTELVSSLKEWVYYWSLDLRHL